MGPMRVPLGFWEERKLLSDRGSSLMECRHRVGNGLVAAIEKGMA